MSESVFTIRARHDRMIIGPSPTGAVCRSMALERDGFVLARDIEKQRATQQRWRSAHPNYVKIWRQAHREDLRAKAALYRAIHPEKVHAAAARHRDSHRRELRISYALYKSMHPEKNRENSHQRRTRLRNQLYEAVDVRAVYERDKGYCHICGKRVKKGEVSLDHLIPISRGGSHTYWNVKIAHRSCNAKRFNTGSAQLLLNLS